VSQVMTESVSRPQSVEAQVPVKLLARKAAQGSMLTLEDALKVIAAAEKKAQEMDCPSNIAVAVVDEGGNFVPDVRMDGSWIGSIDLSINKALTSRAF
jgi:uncharacterized protein GlcG (DUF336 family)